MLQAVGDIVIIKLHHVEKIGSIYIPETIRKCSVDYWGEIISVGPDEKYGLNPGDKIFYPPNEGVPIWYEGEEYLSLKSNYLWGVLTAN